MRNMSFMLTTEQIRNGTKTVTRRIGWWFLKPGDRLMACVKCQGLGKGGKIEKIREIEVVSTSRERLVNIRVKLFRGPESTTQSETAREGFPKMHPDDFIAMFMRHMNCTALEEVNRIEFKYVTPSRKD